MQEKPGTILSIIVLNYKTKDLTKNCLRSILKMFEKKVERDELEVILVDNASFDGSCDAINSQFGNKIKLVQSKENLGFGKGCNFGARTAKGKYILFLNSDTQVLDKGFLGMIEFLDRNRKVAILGGKLENNNGTVQKSCGKFYTLFNLLIMLLGFERFGFLRSSPNKIQKIDWVSGACMMVRKDIFEKLNGFDEKLFMYVEDMEICYRAKKLGYATYFYPSLKLRHKSLGSSNRAFAIINIYKGILCFYSKHRTYPEYLIAKTLLFLKAAILIIVGTLVFNKELADRYKKAIA